MKQMVPYAITSGMSQSGSYILLLREKDGDMQLPIFIGAHEAECVMLAQNGVATRRPMTHQLMATMMEAYGLTLRRVTIDRVVEGVFYATLHVSDGFSERTFDSRTSDAMVLALQAGCPVWAEEAVIEETGMRLERPDADTEETLNAVEGEWMLQSSRSDKLKSLEAELRRCEADEEYERAAEIQKRIDEIKNNEL